MPPSAFYSTYPPHDPHYQCCLVSRHFADEIEVNLARDRVSHCKYGTLIVALD